jgi:hypothetical protein
VSVGRVRRDECRRPGSDARSRPALGCGCLGLSLAPCVGLGFLVRFRFASRSPAMWRVCAIALSFVSGWRAFSSVSLCKSIFALCALFPAGGPFLPSLSVNIFALCGVFVRLRLALFPAGGPFLSSLSVNYICTMHEEWFGTQRAREAAGSSTLQVHSTFESIFAHNDGPHSVPVNAKCKSMTSDTQASCSWLPATSPEPARKLT